MEPELLPGDVRAAMQSEYNTSYNTKADTSTLNQAVIEIASSLSSQHTKTVSQGKTSVLSKMVNSINKTIPYPLVMSAAYLLGHGDSWCPMKTARHDFALFERTVRLQTSAYEDQAADHIVIGLSMDDASAGVDANDQNDSGNKLCIYWCRNVYVYTPIDNYTCRESKVNGNERSNFVYASA